MNSTGCVTSVMLAPNNKGAARRNVHPSAKSSLVHRHLFLTNALWLGLLLALVGSLTVRAEEATNSLQIQFVMVNGKTLPFEGKGQVNVGPDPGDILFGFGATTNGGKAPLRLRYRLEGHDNNWQEVGGDMTLTVRFYNDTGDQIGQKIYSVHGDSPGWTGSLRTSQQAHRRETLVVPPLATRLLVVISSAGPPDAVGIYVVANLTVVKTSGNSGNVLLMQSPFENEQNDPANDDIPPGWIRDGVRPSMAKVVEIGQDPQTKAFAILDDDISSHGEWHNIIQSAPHVTPGESLVVEWNEMYSIGLGSFHTADYPDLPEGKYRFDVTGADVMGHLTGPETSVAIFVPAPFWKTPWFWALAVLVATALVAGIMRYFVWHRMRQEMVRLKQQRALEQERLRIAHDIHDDLGARVTQISLLSAMAQEDTSFPDKARSDFDKVSKMSRELVSALYETVWAVNPENDNLEALGNYICQMVKQLCEQTNLRCRFHVLDLPHEVQVSSQTRHNISMVVKESVHNIIKHAKATEVTIRMSYANEVLDIAVHDDGKGFDAAGHTKGNGLTNMKQRLHNVNGSCEVESQAGQGTTVRLKLHPKLSMEPM